MIGREETVLVRPLNRARRSARLCLAVTGAAFAALALLSCTGAGDGGVSGTNDYLNRGVHVTAPATVPLSHVGLTETAGDATTTCIGVEVHRLSNVFSTSFSVVYDPSVLRYTGSDASTSFLGTGATVLGPQVDATATPGRIVVGLTRNIASVTTGVDSGADGHVLDLCFEVVAAGEFDMIFTGNLAVLQPDGTPVLDLAGNWIGSHVKVVL